MEKILVIGLGISGKAASELLLKKRKKVVASDKNLQQLNTNAEVIRLKEKGLLIFHEDDISDLSGFDLVIVSPGIPQTNLLYKKAIAAGLPVWGEIELGCRLIKNRMVGVTGTNGKTTVTLLVAHALNHAGIKARPLGNVGTPLTKELLEIDENEILVVELSSYQLETLSQKVLDAAVILNITPDHLDRYGTMEAYAEAKFKIGACLKQNAPLFVEARAWSEYGTLYHSPNIALYGYSGNLSIYSDKKSVYFENKFQFNLPDSMTGRESHDVENIMAAYALCKQFNVKPSVFLEALLTFKKPSHRIEWVRELEGVDYYDDSKGTNIDATIRAVQVMPGNVILIAGGVDKGSPYTPWIQAFADKVKCVCAIGQSADKIRSDLAGALNVRLCSDLEEAVREAKKTAKQGDVVLLSPGCSSFDMFRDYAHRGEEFQRVVRGL